MSAFIWHELMTTSVKAAFYGRVVGGEVPRAPVEVPGGGCIIHDADPPGAKFALFGSRI